MPKRKHEEIVENDSAHSDSDNDKFDFEDEVAFDDSEEESGEESQGDSGSELDDDDEFDDDEITESKPNKAKKQSKEAFSDAMTKILASQLKGTDKKQPIMARSKGTERKIEEEKLEYKARKVLAAEKKALKEKGHVIPDYTTFEYEKRLRKVATRGVVKLFNAVRIQQKTTEHAVSEVQEYRKASSALEKAKNVSTMSKSNFLDLLKSGNS
ncbi:hypothetical protein O0I10_005250 [Lichtheimia ornata]|uniref:Rrp15p-domain-containing protein n=1 Tax=Lichtheimia ornata TaxID=688661 RepID=A0AAD7XZQ9_9FUNG|nr:uncharacterized protein O0I10_005250 [Lichtheimia ornata]KAJ8658868.1 hypothetical protein O0I10_005250 [Lichtheimia ornata]